MCGPQNLAAPSDNIFIQGNCMIEFPSRTKRLREINLRGESAGMHGTQRFTVFYQGFPEQR